MARRRVIGAQELGHHIVAMHAKDMEQQAGRNAGPVLAGKAMDKAAPRPARRAQRNSGVNMAIIAGFTGIRV